MCRVSQVQTLSGVVESLNRWPAAVLFDVEKLTGPRLEWLHVGRHLATSGTASICAVRRPLDLTLVNAIPPSHYVPRTIPHLAAFCKEFLDPHAQERLRDIRYQGQEDVFVGEFLDRQVCEAPRGEIDADDGTDVVRVTLEPDGYGFLVHQRSGNSYDVAADFLRYHGDPHYPYYKGRAGAAEEERGNARRIGTRIRELREAARLSQAALAARSGIQRPNISRLEGGRHVPSLETLERIAQALRVPVADLVR
jgi:DNA-binding XRE family transcriptional regulator